VARRLVGLSRFAKSLDLGRTTHLRKIHGVWGMSVAGPLPRNVLGGPLEECGTDPMTGFYRDGCCGTGPQDVGSHTVCAVVTADFLAHQQRVGNDLSTPRPEYAFPGLKPGDRWCVVAVRWLQAFLDGVPAPVVLACTHERALAVIPLDALQQNAIDVPADPGNLL
jgi:uncharacterized protein (DUF2237 family)